MTLSFYGLVCTNVSAPLQLYSGYQPGRGNFEPEWICALHSQKPLFRTVHLTLETGDSFETKEVHYTMNIRRALLSSKHPILSGFKVIPRVQQRIRLICPKVGMHLIIDKLEAAKLEIREEDKPGDRLY